MSTPDELWAQILEKKWELVKLYPKLKNKRLWNDLSTCMLGFKKSSSRCTAKNLKKNFK